MSETLQQKIDTIFLMYDFHYDGSECNAKTQMDKALQEFREQIKKLDTMTPIGFKNEYVDVVAVKDVLALIGEKHE